MPAGVLVAILFVLFVLSTGYATLRILGLAKGATALGFDRTSWTGGDRAAEHVGWGTARPPAHSGVWSCCWAPSRESALSPSTAGRCGRQQWASFGSIRWPRCWSWPPPWCRLSAWASPTAACRRRCRHTTVRPTSSGATLSGRAQRSWAGTRRGWPLCSGPACNCCPGWTALLGRSSLAWVSRCSCPSQSSA